MSDIKERLIQAAKQVQGVYPLNKKGDLCVGSVGCALLTEKGNIYTGVSIELACGIGCCAEHSAIAEMLKARETKIKMIVAIGKRGILTPCGRCRELMMQINCENVHTGVIVNQTDVVELNTLIPMYWKKP